MRFMLETNNWHVCGNSEDIVAARLQDARCSNDARLTVVTQRGSGSIGRTQGFDVEDCNPEFVHYVPFISHRKASVLNKTSKSLFGLFRSANI